MADEGTRKIKPKTGTLCRNTQAKPITTEDGSMEGKWEWGKASNTSGVCT